MSFGQIQHSPPPKKCARTPMFRALAALAQPASFGNRYFQKAVGLFFLVVNYFTCSDDVEKDVFAKLNLITAGN